MKPIQKIQSKNTPWISIQITRLRLEEQMAEIQSVLEGKDRPVKPFR